MLRVLLLWSVGFVLFSCSQKATAPKTMPQEVSVVEVIDTTETNPLSSIFLIEGVRARAFEKTEQAINMFEQAILVDSLNDAAYFQLADICLQPDYYNTQLALQNMQKATLIQPNNELYQMSVGRLLVDNEKYEEGILVFQKLVKQNPKKVDYSYDLAYAYEKAGQTQNALTVYNDLERKYGYSPELNYQKHILYFEEGEKEKGIEEIKEIVDNNPEYATYAVFLAEYYVKTGQFDQAEHYATVAIQQEPANGKAFAILFQSLSKQDKKETFIGTLNTLVNSDTEFDTQVQLLYPLIGVQQSQPTWQNDIHHAVEKFTQKNNNRAEAYALYGDILFNGNKQQEGEKIYQKALTINDNVYSVWDQLMNYYISIEDYQKLGAFAERATVKFPEKPFPAYISGYSYFRNNNLSQSINVLQAATERKFASNQFDIEILGLLAEVYYQNKQYNQAFLTFDKALLKEPDNTIILNNYSYYLATRQHDLDRALKMAKRATQLSPNDANTLDTYGFVLFQKGDYVKAEEILAKAATQIPDSAEVVEHYGDALFKNGKTDQALVQWQKALKMNANNPKLQQKVTQKQFVE